MRLKNPSNLIEKENTNNKPLCACGCGEHVTKNQNTHKWNTYVHGHHFKVGKHRENPKSVSKRMKGNRLGPGRKWTEESKIEFGKNQIGDKNPAWKGGKIVNKSGYILKLIPSRGYVFLHRLIMERKLGRLLTDSEVVHHKNGNRKDNRISNLVLYASQSEHIKAHKYKKRENNENQQTTTENTRG